MSNNAVYLNAGPTTVTVGDGLTGTGDSGDPLVVEVDGSTIAITAGALNVVADLVLTTLTTGGVTLTNGTSLKPDTTTAHTALLQAYDVDGTAYKTFATLTNGNTPSLSIAAPAGGSVTVQPTTYKSSDGTSGAAGGTFTALTSITVKDGIVTAIAGT